METKRVKRSCFFVHGLGEGSFIWKSFIETHEDLIFSFAIDLPGHGTTLRGSPNYFFEQSVQTLVSCVSKSAVSDIFLVGHSFGAAVVLSATTELIAKKIKVAALSLVEFNPCPPGESVIAARLLAKAALTPKASFQDYACALEERRPFLTDHNVIAAYCAATTMLEDGTIVPDFDEPVLDQSALNLQAAEAIISNLSCPIQLIRGRFSSFLGPDEALRIASLCKSPEVFVVDNAGHGLIGENAAGFSCVLGSFLLRHSR